MRKFTLAAILVISGSTSMAQSCIAGQYPFTTNAQDMSGNNYHGAVSNSVLTTDRFGNTNQAYYFNGVDSRIDLSTDFDYASRTVNLWFNASTITTGIDWIFAIDHPSLLFPSCNFYTIEIAGTNYLRYTSGSGGTNNYDVPVSENTWYMATTTMNNTEVKYYLNGQLIATLPYNAGSSTSGGHSKALVGCSRLFDRFFTGTIDDVTIHYCVLDSNEIAQLYTSPLAIADEVTNLNLKLYPNPATDQIIIESDGKLPFDIFNMSGKLVGSGLTNEKVDINALASGMYYARVGQTSIKFIVTD